MRAEHVGEDMEGAESTVESSQKNPQGKLNKNRKETSGIMDIEGEETHTITNNLIFDVPAASQSSNLDFLLSPESEGITDVALLAFLNSDSCNKKQENNRKDESRSEPVSKTDSWMSIEEREEDERRCKEENKKTMNRKYPDMLELNRTRPTRNIKPSLKKTEHDELKESQYNNNMFDMENVTHIYPSNSHVSQA